jgi:putative ATP-dependent DNA ligase
MDEGEYFERLDSTAEDPAELFEHFERRSAAGRTYHAMADARHGVERGTVIVPDVDAVVRGFPSIPRVLVLDPGLRSYFGASDIPVAVEEKLDGFNVRIANVGEPLAFTRGGYVCPYTTGRTREVLDLDTFFADHPEKTICAELVGPETPYTTHEYEAIESSAIRVFGVRDRETGTPLPVERRRALCREYGFPQPRLFGWYDLDAEEHSPSGSAVDADVGARVVDGVREAIADLAAAGREGVVVRAGHGQRLVKYTTESQHHAELAAAFSLPFDYGRDFLFSRIVREAFQAAEFDVRGSGEAAEFDDERLRERARDLGESILLPMVETIHAVEAGETIGEDRSVRGDPERIDALLAHLRDQGLTLEIQDDYREAGERVVEFVKVSESTRDRTEYYLEGGTRDE